MKRRILVVVLCLLFTLGISSMAYAKAGGNSGKDGGNGSKATAQQGSSSGSVDSAAADSSEGQLEDGVDDSGSVPAGKNNVKKQEKKQVREALKSGEGDETEAGEGPKVRLKGKDIKFDIPPVIKDGRTLIPVRAIMNGLGGEVTWDEAAKTVTIVKGEVTVVVTLDSRTITVNGEEQTIDVPAQLISNRTFVPIRFVAQALNMNVDWDEDTDTVDIGDDTDTTEDPADGTEEPGDGTDTTTDGTTTDDTTTDDTTNDGTTTDGTTTDGTTTDDTTNDGTTTDDTTTVDSTDTTDQTDDTTDTVQ